MAAYGETPLVLEDAQRHTTVHGVVRSHTLGGPFVLVVHVEKLNVWNMWTCQYTATQLNSFPRSFWKGLRAQFKGQEMLCWEMLAGLKWLFALGGQSHTHTHTGALSVIYVSVTQVGIKWSSLMQTIWMSSSVKTKQKNLKKCIYKIKYESFFCGCQIWPKHTYIFLLVNYKIQLNKGEQGF